MKYIFLVISGFWYKPIRTALTILSLAIAFILFGVLASLDSGFTHQLEIARLDRLNVAPKFGPSLPMAYRIQIAGIDGVQLVGPMGGLPGYYRDEQNGVFVIMGNDELFPTLPQFEISESMLTALSQNQDGAFITPATADKFGWKVGDRIPITSYISTKRGDNIWSFNILGIIQNVNDSENQSIIGNYEYLDQAREEGGGTVNNFVVIISDPARANEISNAIDRVFINSSAPTRTQPEKDIVQSALQSLGDVRFFSRVIISAVLFMILFVTGNTMMQSARERIPQFSILKTMGYSDFAVFNFVIAESVLLCSVAAVLGLILVNILIPILRKLSVDQAFLLVELPPAALLMGFFLALIVALISGLLPAWQMKKLSVAHSISHR